MSIINEELIEIDVNLSTKDEVITHFADILDAQKRLCNKDLFIRDIYKREEEMSTSMGLGVAIPHTQSDSVKDPSLVFIKLKNPIGWNTDNNVRLIFGIAVPKGGKQNEHLRILSGLARKLMNDDFRDQLAHVEDKEDCLKILEVIE